MKMFSSDETESFVCAAYVSLIAVRYSIYFSTKQHHRLSFHLGSMLCSHKSNFYSVLLHCIKTFLELIFK